MPSTVASTSGGSIGITDKKTLANRYAPFFTGASDDAERNAIAAAIVERNNVLRKVKTKLFTEIEAIAYMANVKFIDLTQKKNGDITLTDATGIERFTQAVNINLAGHELSTVPDLTALSQLDILRLAKNSFKEIPAKLPMNLKFLGLGINQITAMTNYRGLPNLEVLYLHYNQLTEIPADLFDAMPKLALFEFYRNYITDVPEAVFD